MKKLKQIIFFIKAIRNFISKSIFKTSTNLNYIHRSLCNTSTTWLYNGGENRDLAYIGVQFYRKRFYESQEMYELKVCAVRWDILFLLTGVPHMTHIVILVTE